VSIKETLESAPTAGDALFSHGGENLLEGQIRLFGNQSQDPVRVLFQWRNTPAARFRRRAPCLTPAVAPSNYRTSPSYSPKIAHCERSVRLLPGTRVAAIASKDGDAAAHDLILTGWRFSTKGSMRRQCRDGYGPAAQNRPASARKTARSGHAVGR
jgi:hypothetical protein